MDADDKKLLGKIVKAIEKLNTEAANAYLYAREIDLTLQKIPGFADEFRREYRKIHGNEEIPEIAALKKAYAQSHSSFARLSQLLR